MKPRAIETAVLSELTFNKLNPDNVIIFRGKGSPMFIPRPALTIETRSMEQGEGKDMWMCDIIVTAYVSLCENKLPDHGLHERLGKWIRSALSDTSLIIKGAQPLPLIEGCANLPEWDRDNDNESWQSFTFGLVFMEAKQ